MSSSHLEGLSMYEGVLARRLGPNGETVFVGPDANEYNLKPDEDVVVVQAGLRKDFFIRVIDERGKQVDIPFEEWARGYDDPSLT